MRAMLALMLTLAGCVEQPTAPVVRLVGDVHPWFVTGAQAWTGLGFTVTLDALTLDECPPRWFEDGIIDCTITIDIVRDDLAVGGQASPELRRVWLDESTWSGSFFEVVSLSAHEFGHVLLNTFEHLDGRNVMAIDHPTMSPGGADIALACRTIRICS